MMLFREKPGMICALDGAQPRKKQTVGNYVIRPKGRTCQTSKHTQSAFLASAGTSNNE